MGLAFAVPATNRKVETILGATEIILAQLSAITGTKDCVVRLHSDNGLELVTSRFNEAINKKGVFRTTMVPYNPSSNGRAERQVQALKRGALQFLIEGGLERRFWPFCVMEAAACQRDIALGMGASKLGARGASSAFAPEFFYVERGVCAGDSQWKSQIDEGTGACEVGSR